MDRHLKFNLINQMNNMRISGIETLSVIRRQTKSFRNLECDAQKCQNKIKLKGMVKIHPQNYD